MSLGGCFNTPEHSRIVYMRLVGKLMLFRFFFPKNTYALGDGPWSQHVRKPEEPEIATVLPWGKYDVAWRTMIPFRPKPR